jgi:hypothetical protein
VLPWSRRIDRSARLSGARCAHLRFRLGEPISALLFAVGPNSGQVGEDLCLQSERLRPLLGLVQVAVRAQEQRPSVRVLPNLPLEDALQLVRLYGERGSPKFERAALRWLERYLIEGSPRLQHFAEVTTSLAKREL